MNLADIQSVANELTDGCKVFPDPVAGRVAHIDADFLAYHASYERKDETRTLKDILNAADVMVDGIRRKCGAETAVLHITPTNSTKAGRFEASIQKEYQGTRDSKEKPRHLGAVRSYMAEQCTSVITGANWLLAEADDGMAEAAWKAHEAGESNLCVIASRDKDLRIPPCLHLNFDTDALEGADDTFGYIDILTTVRTNSRGKTVKSNKPRGYGTKFFWWQMLMGDTADNIQGLPKILKPSGKYGACGIVAAYDELVEASTDKECFDIVKAHYRRYGKDVGYFHWDTGLEVQWQVVMVSEGKLLWMQREAGDITDVQKFFKEINA